MSNEMVVAAKVEGGLATQPQVFENFEVFGQAQRMAQALAASTIVPKDYQGSVANCLVALEMSYRTKTSPLVVMQNMVIIHGRPSWSSAFLIALVNTCGRFGSMRFEYEGANDDYGCRATVLDLSTGEPLTGPLVTVGMAKAEGWYARNGSKWRTMGETMLGYRAAAFWVRLYAPELSQGMHTDDELRDIPVKAAPVVDAAEMFEAK